jgi:hypothetical protein
MPGMRRSLLGLGLLALGACVDMDHGGSPIVGTSGDVMTEPGMYVGYRVVAPCEERYVNIGVIGTGAVALTEVAEISTAGDELAATLRGDFPSIWGWGGYGLVCETGVGTNVYTNNWQDVDALIVRIGSFLQSRNYALQVGLSVDSQPVAHAGD